MHRGSSDADEATEGLSVVVVGPGLGPTKQAADKARRILRAAAARKIPAIVDAEATAILVEAHAHETLHGLAFVATPHAGEAARLLGTTSAAVQGDRLAAASAIARMLARFVNGVVVLKGACPIVFSTRGPVVVIESAAPALAVAGSGDVLAGIIAGLVARGLDPLHAALVGTDAHQRIGRTLPGRGHLAREIADLVPHALAELEK